ncbi:helix-turn-helix transcriptional regulator [Microbacterium sp.]|uniref:helix-turn-helix transcriptional regulator n=1 Tax=Microbacterium sp. TaxID=51671 RepID=UPI00261B96A6|nr:helix-turn-helix transcriptional regulator [Microbacterium sp.]
MVDVKLQAPSDLARLVKNARAQRGLTQHDVADAVGITRQSLARLERGNGSTSFGTVLLILDHLGIHLDAAVGGHTAAPTAVAAGGSAQAAADALAKRITPLIDSGGSVRELSRRLTATIPGSVLIARPRAAATGSPASPEDADLGLDAAEGNE